MSLTPETITQLLSLLEPLMSNEKERSSLLHQAFGTNAPVLRHIDCSGSLATFIPEMLRKLISHGEVAPGKQALWALLEAVREIRGDDIKERIDKLKPVINSPAKLMVDKVSIINHKEVEQIVEIENLDSSVINPELVKLVNLALTTANESYKNSQLSEEQKEEFESLKEKIKSIKVIDEQLTGIAIQARHLVHEMMQFLESELARTRSLAADSEKGLMQLNSSEELENTIKIQHYESLIKNAKIFTIKLEYGKEAANWLNQNLTKLAQIAAKVALDRCPEIKNQASPKQIDDFCSTVELYLDCISHCCSWGRYNSLDFPEIPLIFEISVYKLAFNFVKEQIPTHLSNAAIEQLQDYIDYLIKRLPYY
jgi:Effector-associated domain 8